MKISCVVSTHNRESVYKTIDSLCRQTRLPEIIVIDDNSVSPVVVSIAGVTVIRNQTTRGLSVCRNIGYLMAKGDAVAFIDDDAYADSHWIEEIEKSFQQGADITGGVIEPVWEGKRPAWFKDYMDYIIGINTFSRMILGCNFAIRKNLLEKLNYWFEEKLGRKEGNLIAGDETTLFFKARAENCKIFFNEHAITYHMISKKRMTLKYFFIRFFWEGRIEARRVTATKYFVARSWHLLCLVYMILGKMKLKLIENFLIDVFFTIPYFYGMFYELMFGSTDYKNID